MGPPPQPPLHAHGLCFFARWDAWLRGGIGEHSPNSWWIDGMEGGADGGGGPAGLRFLLQFNPGNPGSSFDRTLLGFSLSALFSRLLRWSKDGQQRLGGGGSMAAIAQAEGGGEGAAVSAAALAAAVSLCLAAMFASDQRPRRRHRLTAAPALPAPSSAPRPCALPAPRDGLRILSSNPDDESPDSVIHGASIGAGDDEPDIVARVEMDAMPAQVTAVATNADDETETGPDDHPEDEAERQELQRLRELWLSLLEREQWLELRLQELDGLRSEESAAVRELEGRVAAADAETRLLQLRVSTLQEDNGRLRAQVEELDAARAELARAKEKLRAVKARVQGEQEEMAALRARVAELESGGDERAAALAAEVAELRKANAALEEDNMELALQLQDAEQAASASVNLVPEEGMVDEMTYLRESNERLTRQIEQLRSDHCSHVEELVYLKWVNACLRHELLRDHDGGHPTAAEQQGHNAGNRRVVGSRDDLSSALELSKSMSFRSSERAKQLMLRYGHPGLAVFSPLHESVDGDGYERSPASNYEPQQSPCASRSGTAMATSPAAAPGKKAGPRKLKLLGNIKKLLPGGGKRSHSSSHGHGHGHGHDHAGRDAGRKMPAPRDEYLEKAMQWLSTHDVLDDDHSYASTPLSSCDRTPLSSVTTNTTVDSLARFGGGGGETTRPEAEPILARSKSDAGRSYGRDGSRYHELRPDHPTSEADEPDGFRRPEKREARRRSEELRSPAVA